MNKGNRDQSLIKNIMLFGISSFGTKIIYFLLIPLYTACLTTEDYGYVDLINTVISLLIPIMTMGMGESVLKYVIVCQEKKNAVLDCSLIVILVNLAILIAGLFCVRAFGFIKLEQNYYQFLFFSFLLNSVYQILCNYFRGLNLVKYMMIAGIINAFITCSCNIFFLAFLKMGVNGFLCASLIGVFISIIYLIFYLLKKHYYNPGLRKIDKHLFKEMRDYGKPLILNGISWWINNSLDRIIISSILGASANGIYAVAYKIPSILSVFQTIFNQAWTVSAIQEIDSEDKDIFYSKMYKTYEAGMFIICSTLIFVNMFLARILYSKDFFVAWRYTIPLIIAALAGAMSIFISSFFCAVGDTKVIGYTTMAGAGVNLILNIIFIPMIGLMGAAIATTISNVAIWIVRIKKAKDYIQLDISHRREIICFSIILIQSIFAYQETHLYQFQILFLAIQVVFFRQELYTYLYIMKKLTGKFTKMVVRD